MVGKVKKAVAAVKPQKVTAKTTLRAEEVKAVTPSHDEIAQLAEKLWVKRGRKNGHAEQDWLLAEQELRGDAS